MTITEAPTTVLTGPKYDNAHAIVEDAIALMLDKDGPHFVVGYLASFIASRGLAAELAALTAPAMTAAEIALDRLEREGEWT
jgi:hypothetical protein